MQNDELLAQPFDANLVTLSDQPTTIGSGVRVIEGQLGVLASVSRTGTIAWASARAALGRLAWLNHEGRRRDTLPIEEGNLYDLAFSPDGGRLLFTRVVKGTADVYLYDVATQASRRITPSPDYEESPVWSPDGTEVLHSSSQGGAHLLMRTRLDGSGPALEWLRDTGQPTATAWSPDRRHILVSKNVPESGEDIMVVRADDPKQSAPLLTGPGNEVGGVFSPDGRWIAFMSDRSGRFEIYVVRFEGDKSPPALGGPPIQITSDGGVILNGGWRSDGKQIGFRSLDNQVMTVSVDTRNDSVTVGRPVALFRPTLDQGDLAMTPAGDQFVVMEYPYAAGQTIHVLTHWRERLNKVR